MQDQYDSLFSRLREIHPPAQLASGVLMRIQTLQQRSRRRRFMVSVVAAWVSALGAISASGLLVVELLRSGFGQYASLVFSDGAAVLAAWQDYATLLVETFPWASLTVALASVFALITSLRLIPHTLTNGRWTPMANAPTL